MTTFGLPAPLGGVNGNGADPLPGLVGFTSALRHAGLPVTTDRVAAFLGALDQLDVTSRTQTYWAGRLTLCADPDDIGRYDLAFDTWFAPGGGSPTVPVREQPRRAQMAALEPGEQPDGEREDGEEQDVTQLRVAASGTEVLRHRDLAELTNAERAHLRTLLAQLRVEPPLRTSRRRRPSDRGRPDPGRTLRAALRNHGELRELRRRAPGRRARRVVLLIDVSGSMAPYADTLMRFAHVVSRRMASRVGGQRAVEVFTIGTRLTRISRELHHRDPEHALTAAGRAIPDWSGGTRLGDALRAFIDRWGQRGVARRAVVVIFSDGWERGDPSMLGEQLARMRRLAHRVIWVNPHAGKDGYAPIQGGIVAALPYLDELLAGHSLATLERLLEVISGA
jgi:uncharacterized protein